MILMNKPSFKNMSISWRQLNDEQIFTPLFLCGPKALPILEQKLELKAAHVWKIRWMALVQVSCPLFRTDATSWVRNTKDVVAPGVLLGRAMQLWQSSAQKGSLWCVLQHRFPNVHTPLIAHQFSVLLSWHFVSFLQELIAVCFCCSISFLFPSSLVLGCFHSTISYHLGTMWLNAWFSNRVFHLSYLCSVLSCFSLG